MNKSIPWLILLSSFVISIIIIALLPYPTEPEKPDYSDCYNKYPMETGIEDFSFSQESNRISLLDKNGTIHIIDPVKEETMWSNVLDEYTSISSLPNGSHFTDISENGQIVVADVSNDTDKQASVLFFKADDETLLGSFDVLNTFFIDIDLSGDGQRAILEAYNNTFFYLNTSSQSVIWQFNKLEGYTRNFMISDDGRNIIISGDKHLLCFNSSSNKPFFNVSLDLNDGLDITPDGKHFAVGTEEGTKVFMNSSQSPIGEFAKDFYISDVSISDDGKYVASSTNFRVFCHDIQNIKKLIRFQDSIHTGYLTEITPNGKYMATTFRSTSCKVAFFRLDQSEPVWNFKPEGFQEKAGLFLSKNGDYIVVYDSNRYLIVDVNEVPIITETELNYKEISIMISLLLFTIGLAFVLKFSIKN